jgi:putative NADH-flavin reductase
MKICVFGASGKTGILIVYQALNQGHEVTAFARQATKVTIQHKKLCTYVDDLLMMADPAYAQHQCIKNIGENTRRNNAFS